MSYIEKEKLIKADIASIENRVRHAFNQGYDLGFKDGKEKAKPLEQEPVLDKLRAEISDFEEEVFNRPNTDYSDYAAVRHCLEIIDKYKADVEPQKSEDRE